MRYAKDTVPNVDFYVGDITSLKAHKKFDVITLCDVMEHIPRERYKALFENISEHLKENGTVFISIPDPDYLDYVRQKKPHSLQIIDNSITLSEVRELCEEYGLNINFFKITNTTNILYRIKRLRIGRFSTKSIYRKYVIPWILQHYL